MAVAPPGGWPVPRALYVHVPFCRHRCGYCNFSVIAGRDELVVRFLDAIDRELASLDQPTVDTLFIGGGTPTHLDGRQLSRLVESIRRRVDASKAVEWSVEANPEDITADKVALLESLGISRVSLGVQSFNADKLSTLERGHGEAIARRAVELTAARIPNVSLDLIFAAPGETLDTWRKDLEIARSLPIRHLSTYALTFEKGTPFWNRRRRGELLAAAEPTEVSMYEWTRQRMRDAGWEQYEVSNFCAPGARCRHNLSYWEGRGWLAAGPGAASFRGGRREVNHRSTTTYLKRVEAGRSPVADSETITATQYARERAAFGIRMMDGLDLERFRRETGFELNELCGDAVDQCAQDGLVQREAGRLRLTDRGVLFADTVAGELLG